MTITQEAYSSLFGSGSGLRNDTMCKSIDGDDRTVVRRIAKLFADTSTAILFVANLWSLGTERIYFDAQNDDNDNNDGKVND